jgi:hypothetical protein
VAAVPSGDFNGDSAIDARDYSLLVSKIGQTACTYNLTGTCEIDVYDVNELFTLMIPPVAQGSALVYDVAQLDTTFTGTVKAGSTTQPLKFRTIRSADFGYGSKVNTDYKTTIARMATDTSLQIAVTLPKNPAWAVLYSAQSELPTQIQGNKVSFTLPTGPAVYVLKTNVATENSPYAESLAFWIDDLKQLALNPPAGSIQLSPGADLQTIINQAAPNTTIYLKPGLFEYESLSIRQKTNLRLVLHPSAVLAQIKTHPCRNSSPCDDFLTISQSNNITISGPGEIRTPAQMATLALNIVDSDTVTLRDFFLYKIHHEDGWTLHPSKSNNVLVEDVRIITGNDGIDPDSSTNLRFNRMHIVSQDDGVAIKTRGDMSIDQLLFANSIVHSAASALKIGEATVLRTITNVTFENNLVLDSDRGFIVTPRGRDGDIGSIGNVLYKNNRIRFMYKNEQGRSIIVQKSQQEDGGAGSPFNKNTSIVFENNDIEVIEPLLLNTSIKIINSTLRLNRPMEIFEGGSCPSITNLTLDWQNGTGSQHCK